jgi:hypothetical protein
MECVQIGRACRDCGDRVRVDDDRAAHGGDFGAAGDARIAREAPIAVTLAKAAGIAAK